MAPPRLPEPTVAAQWVPTAQSVCARGGLLLPEQLLMSDCFIPLVDLSYQHQQVATEVAEGFERVIGTTSFINGEDVVRFEDAFASYCNVSHCVGVANGTDALELVLRAMDIGPGTEVIVPTNTFVASAEAVARAGAQPVFVDCDPNHLLIDVALATERIGPRTRAILAVDLFGQVAPIETLEMAADSERFRIIEDAAQAHGATRHGRLAGSFGVAAGTSFYPGKNLGAYGDAGAVLTNSSEVATRVRELRNHGGQSHYVHSRMGFNSRLDTLQAVVLGAKLRYLTAWNEARRQAARNYHELLADMPIVTRPTILEGNEHVWHLYVIRVPRRDEVLASLRNAGIGAGIHYPVPVHLQPAFHSFGGGRGTCPVAEEAAETIMSLPLFPGITQSQQEQVAEALRAALR